MSQPVVPFKFRVGDRVIFSDGAVTLTATIRRQRVNTITALRMEPTYMLHCDDGQRFMASEKDLRPA